MYKRNSIKKLGKKTSHRKSLIKNQLRSILQSGKISTSSVKAKVIKGELESILSKVKKSDEKDLSLYRSLLDIFGKKDLVKKLFEIGKKDTTKVSIKKIGFRAGDNTQVSQLEIVGFKSKPKSKKVTKVGKETEEKEEVVEVKKEEEKKRGILNLGRKNVTKGTPTVKKERARSRSGL